MLHTAATTHARFDDPNLVSHAGLIPAVRLAQNIGLEDLARRHVRVRAKVGANAGLKIGALVAGMVAGADTIDGMDLLRHGAFPATVGGIRAPSTLGSFLRGFDHGTQCSVARMGSDSSISVFRADMRLAPNFSSMARCALRNRRTKRS